MSEPIYELKKDVSMPGRYWRAGAKKTEAEWKKEFGIKPDYPFQWCMDWFIPPPEEPNYHIDEVKEVVKSVFDRQQLHSITYREAAEECCREVLARFYSIYQKEASNEQPK